MTVVTRFALHYKPNVIETDVADPHWQNYALQGGTAIMVYRTPATDAQQSWHANKRLGTCESVYEKARASATKPTSARIHVGIVTICRTQDFGTALCAHR